MDKGERIAFLFVVVLYFVMTICCYAAYSDKRKCEKKLVQPPNYDKESLLELLEKGECAGGTIDEGRFSVFVCKE